jgi:hypothetical protein
MLLPGLKGLCPKIERKEADLSPGRGGFTPDEEKIKRLPVSILDNALTFNDKKCIIELDLHRKDALPEILLFDTGGMPEEDLSRITGR